MRKLVGGELSHEDGACIVKLVHHARVESRYVVGIDFGVARRADSGRCVDVFEAERYAVERTAIAAFTDLAFCLAGLGDGCLGRNRDERVDDRIN